MLHLQLWNIGVKFSYIHTTQKGNTVVHVESDTLGEHTIF